MYLVSIRYMDYLCSLQLTVQLNPDSSGMSLRASCQLIKLAEIKHKYNINFTRKQRLDNLLELLRPVKLPDQPA